MQKVPFKIRFQVFSSASLVFSQDEEKITYFSVCKGNSKFWEEYIKVQRLKPQKQEEREGNLVTWFICDCFYDTHMELYHEDPKLPKSWYLQYGDIFFLEKVSAGYFSHCTDT